LAYQPPASSTFLSEQTSHQQPTSSTFLSEQTSTSHQPAAVLFSQNKPAPAINHQPNELRTNQPSTTSQTNKPFISPWLKVKMDEQLMLRRTFETFVNY
jgi:hypothetical protein